MRFRLGLTTGFAAGYVLGTRAGHEQYERIMNRWQRMTDSPQLQKAVEEGHKLASTAAEKAAGVVHTLRTRAEEDMEMAASAVEPDGHAPATSLP